MYVKVVNTVAKKMLHTPEKPYLFYHNKPAKVQYPEDIIGGIEIETCISDEINVNLKYYVDVSDLSVKCRDGFKEAEFIAEPVPMIELIDPSTEIGKETKCLLEETDKCLQQSCGTHVHMSMNSVTVDKYPHFDILMRYFWVQYYQPYCLFHFYKHEERYENPYCNISTNVPSGRDEMFNITPSYELPEGVLELSPTRPWHFEFRGYGSMHDKLNTEYLHVLMNLWITTLRYYTFILKDAKQIKRNIKDMFITKLSDVRSFDTMKLLLMLHCRNCTYNVPNEESSDMSVEEICKRIEDMDTKHKLGNFSLKGEYYKLNIVYQPPSFRLKM